MFPAFVGGMTSAGWGDRRGTATARLSSRAMLGATARVVKAMTKSSELNRVRQLTRIRCDIHPTRCGLRQPRRRCPLRSSAMSLKHAVLALIVERRGYGYELVQRFEERVGPGWQLNPSAVYPALDQLERGGLVTSVARHGGTRRSPRIVYAATTAGEAALEAWLTRDGRAARAGARGHAPADRVRTARARDRARGAARRARARPAKLLARYPRPRREPPSAPARPPAPRWSTTPS